MNNNKTALTEGLQKGIPDCTNIPERPSAPPPPQQPVDHRSADALEATKSSKCYIVSIVGVRNFNGSLNISNSMFEIVAENEDEAIGRAVPKFLKQSGTQINTVLARPVAGFVKQQVKESKHE